MNSEFVGFPQSCHPERNEMESRDLRTKRLLCRNLVRRSFDSLRSLRMTGRSEVCDFRRLQLKLQFVSDKGDELRIGGFSLGIADRISEESLQSVQIASVPGDLDGVSDGTLHSGRRGLEGFRHLGVEYLGDGIDHIHVIHRNDDGFP